MNNRYINVLLLSSLLASLTACGTMFRKGSHRNQNPSTQVQNPNTIVGGVDCSLEENKGKDTCLLQALCEKPENKDLDSCKTITITTEPLNPSVTDPAAGLIEIPRSFMGFSQEWPWVGDMTHSKHIFDIIDLLKNEENGPLVMRVGGADGDVGYDESIANPTKSAGINSMWTELKKLKEKSLKFIITINLANRDKELAKKQVEAARTNLGEESILSYEIGNEPNYYKDQKKALWPVANFYTDIVTQFTEHAEYIGCNNNCTGPAWGWIGLNPFMLDNYLKANKGRLNYASVHFYKSAYKTNQTNHVNDTAETLLDDAALQEKITTLVPAQVSKGREYNVPVRFTEANTISGGGNEGVSDVYAAALWTLDTSLELAANGVAGVDFHQGSYKYAFYRRFTKPVSGEEEYPYYQSYKVQPSFYGIRFFQQAIGARTRIKKMSGDRPSQVKVYQLYLEQELRTVLVNKNVKFPQKVKIRLPVTQAGSSASLIRMLAPNNDIKAKTGITIAGINYDGWGGAASGQYTAESVAAQADEQEGFATFEVILPPASAALLTLKK